MPNMDDFHAFQSTTGGGSGGGDSGGCLSPTAITIVVIIAILYIIGKIAGQGFNTCINTILKNILIICATKQAKEFY